VLLTKSCLDDAININSAVIRLLGECRRPNQLSDRLKSEKSCAKAVVSLVTLSIGCERSRGLVSVYSKPLTEETKDIVRQIVFNDFLGHEIKMQVF